LKGTERKGVKEDKKTKGKIAGSCTMPELPNQGGEVRIQEMWGLLLT